MNQVNAYNYLYLSEQSTKAQITENYRILIRLYHPDKNKNDEYAAAESSKINSAYSAITSGKGQSTYFEALKYVPPKGRSDFQKFEAEHDHRPHTASQSTSQSYSYTSTASSSTASATYTATNNSGYTGSSYRPQNDYTAIDKLIAAKKFQEAYTALQKLNYDNDYYLYQYKILWGLNRRYEAYFALRKCPYRDEKDRTHFHKLQKKLHIRPSDSTDAPLFSYEAGTYFYRNILIYGFIIALIYTLTQNNIIHW